MFLGAVKPYVFGFGFRVGSKICGELNQKVLYVQKLWKSLLTRGINRKKKTLSQTEQSYFSSQHSAALLLSSADSKALKTFF